MNYHCPRPPKQRAFDTSLLMWRRRFLGGSFSPASLFASGEDGGWYDPSDLTSMSELRASVGSTNLNYSALVTPGKSIGTILDKSQMGGQSAASYIQNNPNSNLILNGTFDTDTTNWAANSTTLSVVNGAMRVQDTNGRTCSQAFSTVVGSWYVILFDFVGGTTTCFVRAGTAAQGTQNGISQVSSPATKQFFVFKATSTTTYIGFTPRFTDGSSVYVDIDNVSVKELPGNHLVAPSDAARPVLRDEIVEGTSVDVSGQPELWNQAATEATIAGNAYEYISGDLYIVERDASGSGSIDLVPSGVIEPYKHYKITLPVVAAGTQPTDNAIRVLFNGTALWTDSAGTSSSVWSQFFTEPSETITRLLVAQSDASISLLHSAIDRSFGLDRTGISVREVPASAARRYYLDFDGVDDVLYGEVLTVTPTSAHIFAGVYYDAASDYAAGVNAPSGERFAIAVNASGFAAGEWDDVTSATLVGASDVRAAPIVHALVATSSTSAALRVNGAEIDTATSTAGAALSGEEFAVGGLNNAGSLATPLDGRLYGLVYQYNRVLTAAERENLEIYLANKSGATLA